MFFELKALGKTALEFYSNCSPHKKYIEAKKRDNLLRIIIFFHWTKKSTEFTIGKLENKIEFLNTYSQQTIKMSLTPLWIWATNIFGLKISNSQVVNCIELVCRIPKRAEFCIEGPPLRDLTRAPRSLNPALHLCRFKMSNRVDVPAPWGNIFFINYSKYFWILPQWHAMLNESFQSMFNRKKNMSTCQKHCFRIENWGAEYWNNRTSIGLETIEFLTFILYEGAPL